MRAIAGLLVKVKDILDPRWVVPSLAARGKVAALRELTQTLCARCEAVPSDAETVLAALLARERMGSTGVGDGIAIPHARIANLPHLVACFGRAEADVDFDAIDRRPVHLIFLLLIPEDSSRTHLKALARISRLLKDPGLRQRLMAEAGAHLWETLVEEDARH